MARQTIWPLSSLVFALIFGAACGTGSSADVTLDSAPTEQMLILERREADFSRGADTARSSTSQIYENPVVVVEGERRQLHEVRP
jgi:hypothetical protein